MDRKSEDCGELTHVHRTEQTHSWEKKTVQKQPGKRKRKKKNSRIIGGFSVIIVLCGMLPGIISLVRDAVPYIMSETGEAETEAEYEYDPYALLTRDFQEGGEEYSVNLSSGEYVVGIHIPEGRYTIKGSENDYGSVSIEDDRNSIWMYVSLYEYENYEQEDIRLFLGARVSVDTYGEVEFVSENAQVNVTAYQENPLTEPIVLDKDSETAGIEFLPGVYDIVMEEGYGEVTVEIPDGDGSQWGSHYIWLDAADENQCVYRNIVIPEGAIVTSGEEVSLLMLIPSKQIINTDYTSYYTGEYLNQEPFAGLFEELGEGTDL